ncbi:hypothetical protein [Bradyrhizobium sp. RDI18]|uniref:hypothetical protein n=1 Tax=Bradyrhizobium sp. RDI18 TaxID=3367400 RepID=UPI003713E175
MDRGTQPLKVESYGREQNASGPEALATEIVRSNPDVVHVFGPGAVIFKKLRLVFRLWRLLPHPVKQGIAESLAHPGGNFTGASIDAGLSIHGKRIALLGEMVPTMSKLGCLAFSISMEWGGKSLAPCAAAEMGGFLSRYLYWNLLPAKQTIGRRSRVSAVKLRNAVMVVDLLETHQRAF